MSWFVMNLLFSTFSVRESIISRSQSRSSSFRTNISLGMRNVLALDFDGVIAASNKESSISAIHAVRKQWPQVSMPLEVLDSLRDQIMLLRPIIETGYENMLVCRYLVENYSTTGRLFPPEINNDGFWTQKRRDDLIERYGVPKEQLIKAFASSRDEYIARDLNAWIQLNDVFPLVAESIKGKLDDFEDFYIITTKQERFVRAIMQSAGLTAPPPSRMFDLDSKLGPKPQVLRHIINLYTSRGVRSDDLKIHFVEDRLDTLLAVAKETDLERVRLYLVDWGYNTAEQRAAANSHPRISLINYHGFRELVDEVTQR